MKKRIMVKHIPQRTCVACRTVKPKRELARLVRLPGGDVVIDRSGKTQGRGAYLCRNLDCWSAGLKGNRLGHTLRTTVSKDNLEWLMEQGRNILED